MLILVRNKIPVSHVECGLSNVCMIDMSGVEVLRIASIYVPVSRSWTWYDLSPFLSQKCVLFGDFNVDLDQDRRIAEMFRDRVVSNFLASCTPEVSTL